MYLKNSTQLLFENDVFNFRIRNSVVNGSDNFYFNGFDGKTEAVCLSQYSSNLTYNILANGENIGQVKVLSKAPTRYYYLKDHLGSVKMTVDTSGTVVGLDDYYPYGSIMNGRSYTSSADQRYKFTGKERSATTGLDYFGARDYDSWRAQWLQVDPMTGARTNLSPYNYCQNNPITKFDPTGMFDGDYWDEYGKKIGTDGINDKKNYLVPNANSAIVSEALNSPSILKSEQSAQQVASSNSVLLPNSSAISRMESVVCSASPWNETGGVIYSTVEGIQKVVPAVPGESMYPAPDVVASINVWKANDPNSIKGTDIPSATFHVHPNGQLMMYGFEQQPSSVDIHNAASNGSLRLNNYVFGASSNKVYLYNGSGVIGSMPAQSFFNLGQK